MGKYNKINKTISLALCAVITCMIFSACSKDTSVLSNGVSYTSESKSIETQNTFSIEIKALNSNNEDVTTQGDLESAVLYIFDENKKFIKTISIDKDQILNRREISIDGGESKSITVIAWGGLEDDRETVTMPNTIEDIELILNTEENGKSAQPSDLFYGKVTCEESNGTNEISMSRKVSNINISTKNLLSNNKSTDTYYYKIGNLASNLNYDGEKIGNYIDYKVAATLDEDGTIIAKSISVLSGTNIVVELYKNDTLIFSKDSDHNGNALTMSDGTRSEIYFENDADITTYIYTVDWNTVLMYATVD